MVNVKVIIIKDQGAMVSYFPKNFSTTINIKFSGSRQFFRRSRGLFFAKSFIINDRRLTNIWSFSTTSGGNGTNFGYFLFLAISSSLSHLACNSAIILTFSSILTWMAFKVAKGLLSMVSVLAVILLIKED